MKKIFLITLILFSILTPIINADYQDPFFEVSKDNVPGHIGIHKFGHNEALDTSFETIWSGSNLYTYPPAATQMNLTSSDVDDTNGGTGAWNVTVLGLDANYDFINETITLNGQTPVLSTNSYIRIWRMIVRYSGASDYNEGIIYLGTGATVAGVPTNIYAMIDAQYGITYMTQFTVPNGYTGYITTIRGTCFTVNKNFEVYLRIRPFGESWLRREEWHIQSGEAIPADSGNLPYRVESMSDIQFMGKVDVAGGIAEINYDIVLVQDGYELIDQVYTVTGEVDVMSMAFFGIILIAFTTLIGAWVTNDNKKAAFIYAFSAVFWIATMYLWATDHVGTSEWYLMFLFLVPLTFCIIMFLEKNFYTIDDAQQLNMGRKKPY